MPSISRRDFLTLAGGTALAWQCRIEPLRRQARAPHQPLGIQLYTVRDRLERDFAGTLADLATIGYTEVESWNLFGRSAADVRALLDRHGLRAPSGHVPLEAVTDSIDQTIADARTLGHTYVIVPWLPEKLRTPDGYRSVAATFNQAGQRLAAAGLTLGYHNHDFEFQPLMGGPCGYDLLLAGTDPALVVMELDLYWVRKGGGDARRYFSSHRGRFRCVHVKDMAADGTMTDLGKGVIDWPALLVAAREAGVSHFFTEHDGPDDSLRFAREAYRYLSRLTF